MDGRTVTTFHGNTLLSLTLLIVTPRLLDPLDRKSSCIMSFGDSSICWPRQITIATFSSGMISIAVGVFHLHFFQAQMLVHPSFSACTWRKSDQGWKTSATPPFTNSDSCVCAVFQYSASCWFDVFFIDFCTEYVISTSYSIMCTNIGTCGSTGD